VSVRSREYRALEWRDTGRQQGRISRSRTARRILEGMPGDGPDEQYAHSPSLRAPNGVLELFEKQRNVFFDEITSFLKQ
jgi:hypothetical protein